VIQSSGLVPVISTNRRFRVAYHAGLFDSCATVIGSCSLFCAQWRRCESHGLACSPTGLSINCACPPSRCGETTSRRATRFAVSVPKSLRMRCRQRSIRPRYPRSEDVSFIDIEDIRLKPDCGKNAVSQLSPDVSPSISVVETQRCHSEVRPATRDLRWSEPSSAVRVVRSRQRGTSESTSWLRAACEHHSLEEH